MSEAKTENKHKTGVKSIKHDSEKDKNKGKSKEEKEVLEAKIGSETCQPMMVAVWIKKMSNDEMDEFIEFMERLGFTYVEHKEPEKKELKGKVIIIFFSYNSCSVCKIFGVERPLSMDMAMLDYINTVFKNKVIDFHNINPRCDYLKSKEEKGVKDLDGGN